MTTHSLGRRTLALLLTLMLAMGCMPASAANKKSTVATKRTAVLYKSASTKSKKLMNVSLGSSVTVISSKGNWKRVEIGGKRGYMQKSAFTEAKPTATPKPKSKPKKTPKPTPAPASKVKIVAAPDSPVGQAAPKGKGTAMITQQVSKLYNKAKTSSKHVQIGEGVQVTVRSQGSKWSRVNVNGRNGYMPTSSFQRTIKQKSKLYKSNSTQSGSVTLSKGTKVSILSEGSEWIKVRRGGRNGYVLSSAFTAAAAPTPAPADDEKDVRKTTVKSALYQKPSNSSKHTSVKKGTSVTVLSEEGSWLKVKIGSKSGYMPEKAFAEAAAPTPVPAPTQAAGSTSDSYKKLKAGSSGIAVKNLQIRLEDLGYLDSTPNSRYGASTVAAVKLFQAASGIKKNGVADNKTQIALYAGSAVRSSIQSASMSKGSKGAQVKRLQSRLSAKGYFKARKTGIFTDATLEAVKAFQRQAGLGADGIAGRATLSKLFSSAAPAASDRPVATPTPGPTVKPTATPAPSGGSSGGSAPPVTAEKKRKANEVIAFAMAQLGKPYVFGSNGPNSWDCSGFTAACYAKVGISLPHSAYLQGYNFGTKIGYSQLVRGDLISWNTVSDGDLSDHVGIYLGNNQAIHASSGYGKVIISPIDSGYYQRVFSWGRALF